MESTPLTARRASHIVLKTEPAPVRHALHAEAYTETGESAKIRARSEQLRNVPLAVNIAP